MKLLENCRVERKPRRWRAVLGLSMFFASSIAFLAFWFTCYQDRITLASYQRIRNGMSLAEVERLLGGAQGEHTTRPTEYWQCYGGGESKREGRSGASKYQWRGDKGLIDVELDEQQQVVGKYFASGHEMDAKPPFHARVLLELLLFFGIDNRVRE